MANPEESILDAAEIYQKHGSLFADALLQFRAKFGEACRSTSPETFRVVKLFFSDFSISMKGKYLWGCFVGSLIWSSPCARHESRLSKNMEPVEQRSWEAIREDFPILRQMINGYPLIYFDNAATSQKPARFCKRSRVFTSATIATFIVDSMN